MVPIKLIEPVVIKKQDGIIVIPEDVSRHVKEDTLLVVYVKSKKKIDIQGIKILPGNKLFDVLIFVNKEHVNQGFSSIMSAFKSNPAFDIAWTTGFCIPDDGDTNVDACTWEGIVSSPENTNDSDIKKMIMNINLEYDERVIRGSTVHEVNLP